MNEPQLSIGFIEEDVLLFSFVFAGRRIEGLTNFIRNGPELRLVRLHLEGDAKNSIGRATLWQVAYQLGRYFGAQTLRIEGGRRTTGRYKGQVPTPFIIEIPTS